MITETEIWQNNLCQPYMQKKNRLEWGEGIAANKLNPAYFYFSLTFLCARKFINVYISDNYTTFRVAALSLYRLREGL
jgi:hypothetical protein